MCNLCRIPPLLLDVQGFQMHIILKKKTWNIISCKLTAEEGALSVMFLEGEQTIYPQVQVITQLHDSVKKRCKHALLSCITVFSTLSFTSKFCSYQHQSADKCALLCLCCV